MYKDECNKTAAAVQAPRNKTHHESAIGTLEGLENAIDSLEDLRDRIIGNDTPKAELGKVAGYIPLRNFLQNLSDDIATKEIRIRELVGDIKSALF